MATMKWTSLKNNPDLKQRIELVQSELKEVNSDDTERHLADTGCSLRQLADELKDLSEKAFERHNKQKVV